MFYCDQCDFKTAHEKDLRHHVRMQHWISQLDGVDDIKLNKNKENNKPVENSCALCKEGGRFCTETCKDPCEDRKS